MDNEELNAAIREPARTTHIGDVLAARGITAVALNNDGHLTRYHPDGTTSSVLRNHNKSPRDTKARERPN